MSNGIMVEINRDAFEFLCDLIAKEYEYKLKHNSIAMAYPEDHYINKGYFEKAVSGFVESVKKYSEEMICLEYLKEVFNLPMVNMRLSDEEVDILDYGVAKGNYSSRKGLMIGLVKEFVKGLVELPEDVSVTDKELLVFVEAQKIREYENIRHFIGEEQFKMMIEESTLFDSITDYEEKKNKILGKTWGVDKNE